MEGAAVQEPVNEITQELRTEFQCSYGWLQRCSITWQAMGGESSVVDVQSADRGHGSVISTIKQYMPKNIFNMDETYCFIMHRCADHLL